VRVLVTGVSGFSGSYVARALAAAGHDVTGLYRRETAFLALARTQPGITLVAAALDCAGELAGPYEAIIHTAATSPAPGITNAMIVRDNLEGTTALLDAAARWNTRRFVFFSSLSLYGDVTAPLLDEDTPIINPDVYGVTKQRCERLLAESSIPGLSLRLPGVLGPGAHRNWLSGVAAKLRVGQPIAAFHLDAPFNNAAHIADIAKLVTAVLGRAWTGFDAVVLGACDAIPVRTAIMRLADALGAPANIVECAPSKPHFQLSSERAITRWGYDPMEIGAMIERYGREIPLTDA
jgi:nucleoside-diphosphate-sugar epimerase